MSGSTRPCTSSGPTGICPCDQFVHPQMISNLPGRASISYRVGDYVSFREALLRSRLGEVELANWRPGASGDLAVQMVEWWAYLSDILTFYNERIANEDYLRTAVLPASVQRLIGLLGYRPRPGIGARGVLAALLSGNKPLTLPMGFQIQSKPGPGKQPQIFELDAPTKVQQPDVLPALPPDDPALFGPDGNSVLVAGAIASINPGAQLLIIQKGWDGGNSNYRASLVRSTSPEKDARGRANTRVTFQSAASVNSNSGASIGPGGQRIPTEIGAATLPTSSSSSVNVSSVKRTLRSPFEVQTAARQIASAAFSGFSRGSSSSPATGASTDPLTAAQAADYRLQRSNQSARVWQYPASLSDVLSSNSDGTVTAHLDALTRQIHVGDAILLDGVGGSRPQVLGSVTGYGEQIYYANPDGSPPDPTKAPAHSPAISILHSVITFQTDVSFSSWSVDINIHQLLVGFGWQDVGTLIGTPSTALGNTQLDLLSPLPASTLPITDEDILISDANGNGAEAAATVGTSDPSTIGLSSPNGPSDASWAEELAALGLKAPLNVMFDLLAVSRGKTVANEVLGSGNAMITAGQEFLLEKSPLTYLEDPNSVSGDGYTSTLQIWVNGVRWQEVPSFYNQPPGAHIFVTREDENNVTHVQFGDGVNGGRL
ncbi:MAG: hypothetical protein FWD12_15965, partial [Alphaproteobacteria bacterium]|nr:hypothetical protein [Alphaproteobacteria bacterium]